LRCAQLRRGWPACRAGPRAPCCAQALRLEYSEGRSWGSFTPTNLPELLAALAALGDELAALGRSPYAGGVLCELERTEQLLGGVARSLQVGPGSRGASGCGAGGLARVLVVGV
jgi:hypothetical protein